MRGLALAIVCGVALVGGARAWSWWANGRVVRELRASVLRRLRPTAPGFLGTLIVVEID